MVRVTIIFKSIVILLFKKKDYRELHAARCIRLHQSPSTTHCGSAVQLTGAVFLLLLLLCGRTAFYLIYAGLIRTIRGRRPRFSRRIRSHAEMYVAPVLRCKSHAYVLRGLYANASRFEIIIVAPRALVS